MITTLVSLLLLAPSASPDKPFSAPEATLELHPLVGGAMPKIGFYVPQRLALSETKPANFTNTPTNAALYGTLSFGGKSLPVIELQDAGKPTGIEIDFKGSGDFATADSATWKPRPADPSKPTGFQLYMTDINIPSPIADGKGVDVKFYRFDPTDARRVQLKSTLLYYADYALDGTATLGDKKYHVMLTDTMTQGVYGATGAKGLGNLGAYTLLIDRDGDGKFQSPYETFDASKPFNIGGTTYELSGLGANVSKIAIRKSSQVVAEIPIPPSFAAGKKVLSFTAVDRNGKTVHFPEDFKGKVVMLDFWATWCGPCMGEVPNVVKVYNQLHGEGFEILGISLDNSDTINKITPVTQANGMTWDQIADGKYWDAAIAKLYGVRAIPAAYIVDGDTGTIFAEGEAIRGENLLPAVQKALASKKK